MKRSMFVLSTILTAFSLLLGGCAVFAAPASTPTSTATLIPIRTSTPTTAKPGFFTAECGGGTVETAVLKAYKESLVESGSSPEEAEELKGYWATSNPRMQIVVISSDRQVEVFTSAEAFGMVAINDPSRYPGGCLVAISSLPWRGDFSLSDYVLSWGGADRIFALESGGIVIEVLPDDKKRAENLTYRP